MLLLILILTARSSLALIPAASLLIAGLIFCRGAWWDFIRGLRYLVLFFLLIFLLPILSFGFWKGLEYGALSAEKILMIYATGFLLTRLTSRWEIAAVMERVLSPFARLSKLPLMLALTLGFLPLLGANAHHLAGSFTSRVGNRNLRRGGWLRNLPFLIGAFFSLSLERSERLSRTLYARGFMGRLGSGGNLFKRKISLRDLLFLALFAVSLAVTFLLQRGIF